MSEDERAARDRFFAVVDELRLNLPDVSQIEVEADMAAAIEAIRAGQDSSLPDISDFRRRFQESLAEVGYGEREELLALTREVRQERAEEIDSSADSILSDVRVTDIFSKI